MGDSKRRKMLDPEYGQRSDKKAQLFDPLTVDLDDLRASSSLPVWIRDRAAAGKVRDGGLYYGFTIDLSSGVVKGFAFPVVNSNSGAISVGMLALKEGVDDELLRQYREIEKEFRTFLAQKFKQATTPE
jgi:hypothetical protein